MSRATKPTRSACVLLCAAAGALVACSDAGRFTDPAAPSRAAPALADPSLEEAAAATFTTIDVPGATGTFALDINAHGDVVGRYLSAGRTHGFLRSAAGDLTTIDYPGAVFTVAAGINGRGDIVGMYALPTAPAERHGYLLRDGSFTSIDPDGATFTNALGINSRGDIVGRYCTKTVCRRAGSGDFHGFLVHDGAIRTIDVAGSIETNAWKINGRGQIVGAYVRDDGTRHLFVRHDDDVVSIDLPDGRPAAQDNGAINARGEIAGVYCDASPCEIASTGTHGFVLGRGRFTTIDYPGASATGVFGLTVRGDVAGAFYDATGRNHGFLFTRRDR